MSNYLLCLCNIAEVCNGMLDCSDGSDEELTKCSNCTEVRSFLCNCHGHGNCSEDFPPCIKGSGKKAKYFEKHYGQKNYCHDAIKY